MIIVATFENSMKLTLKCLSYLKFCIYLPCSLCNSTKILDFNTVILKPGKI